MSTTIFTYFTVGILFLLLSFLETVIVLLPSQSPPLLRLRFVVSIVFSVVALPSTAAALPFLLFSLSHLLRHLFPPTLLDLLLSFAFSQILVVFSLPFSTAMTGVENHYFRLLLVPVGLCAASSAVASVKPFSVAPRLLRSIALLFTGTWFLQMGFSFFTTAIASGCHLTKDGVRDFSIVCDGHESLHRANAIATLQFNCHVAAIVVVGVVVYGVVARRAGGEIGYSVLGKEMTEVGEGNFQLEDDDDEEVMRIEEIGSKRIEDIVLDIKKGDGIELSRS